MSNSGDLVVERVAQAGPGNVLVATDGALEVGTVAATGAIGLVAGTDVTVTGRVASRDGDAGLTAGGGVTVTDAGIIQAGGAGIIQAGGQVSGLRLAAGTDVSIQASDTIALDDVSAGRTVLARSLRGDIGFADVSAGGTLVLDAGRNVFALGTSLESDAITLTARAGRIGTPANPLALDTRGRYVAVRAGRTISLREETGDLRIDRLAAGGDVRLVTSDGDVAIDTVTAGGEVVFTIGGAAAVIGDMDAPGGARTLGGNPDAGLHITTLAGAGAIALTGAEIDMAGLVNGDPSNPLELDVGAPAAPAGVVSMAVDSTSGLLLRTFHADRADIRLAGERLEIRDGAIGQSGMFRAGGTAVSVGMVTGDADARVVTPDGAFSLSINGNRISTTGIVVDYDRSRLVLFDPEGLGADATVMGASSKGLVQGDGDDTIPMVRLAADGLPAWVDPSGAVGLDLQGQLDGVFEGVPGGTTEPARGTSSRTSTDGVGDDAEMADNRPSSAPGG